MATSPVLIVDPHHHFRERLSDLARDAGCEPVAHPAFPEARQHIAATPHTVVITRVRLGSFNGIHLVYLARLRNPTARCIVHGDDDDAGLGIEAQQAGAFYERSDFLPFSLSQYLTCDLPDTDRRNARCVDRRGGTFRGGRRATDREALRATMTSLPQH